MKIKFITEIIVFFIILPVTILVDLLPKYMIIPSLWAVSLYAYFVLRLNKEFVFYDKPEVTELFYVLKRFLLFGITISLFTLVFYPEKLFYLILNEPYIYLAVVIFYPILSVIPQELVFRKFFFYRYRINIPGFTYILFNAIVFGFVHIAFGNYIAVMFTVLGGLLFAGTYRKTNSLTLVTVEHTLYGILIFTLGLGEFFYHNNGLN
jgi:membrane protease YdiL (CAAX protease family)